MTAIKQRFPVEVEGYRVRFYEHTYNPFFSLLLPPKRP